MPGVVQARAGMRTNQKLVDAEVKQAKTHEDPLLGEGRGEGGKGGGGFPCVQFGNRGGGNQDENGDEDGLLNQVTLKGLNHVASLRFPECVTHSEDASQHHCATRFKVFSKPA